MLVLRGLGMFRHAFNMHLGRLSLVDDRRHHLLGCRRRRCLLAAPATAAAATLVAATFGLLGRLARHRAGGIFLGIGIGLGSASASSSSSSTAAASSSASISAGGSATSWVIVTGASPATCARSRSIRNCEVIWPSSPRHTTRMP